MRLRLAVLAHTSWGLRLSETLPDCHTGAFECRHQLRRIVALWSLRFGKQKHSLGHELMIELLAIARSGIGRRASQGMMFGAKAKNKKELARGNELWCGELNKTQIANGGASRDRSTFDTA